VIAAAVGGLRTAVADGISGLLVPGHHPDDYAAAVRRLLDDPALRSRLSQGGQRQAAGFSWSATATGVLQVYDDALAEPATRVAAAR